MPTFLTDSKIRYTYRHTFKIESQSSVTLEPDHISVAPGLVQWRSEITMAQ